MSVDAGNLLLEVFPSNVMSQLYIGVNRGYLYVKQIMDTDFLNNPIGRDNIANLKNIAVQYELARMSRAGLLPFTVNIKNNKRGANHLELRTNNPKTVLTISQVPYNKKYMQPRLPKPALFRQSLSVTNGQITMADTFPEIFSSSQGDNSEIHLILTHGYQTEEPKFIYVGIPDPDNKFWLDTIPIIGIMPSSEAVEKTELMEFAMRLAQNKALEDDEHGKAEQ
jgi:hypothetical protein